jgi:hypothetical protein
VPSYGFSLMCELYDPNELPAQAARAEAARFDFHRVRSNGRIAVTVAPAQAVPR